MLARFTLLTTLFISSALYSLAVYNPGAPAFETDGVFFCDDCNCWAFKLGYRGDYVFDRYLQSGTTLAFPARIFTNAGVLTLNLLERLDVYGYAGVSESDLTLYTTDTWTSVHDKSKFSWGLGAKLVVWECTWGRCGTTYAGIDAQYAWLEHPHSYAVTELSSEGSTIDIAIPGDFRAYWREWQFALGITHKFSFIAPYAAIKWSSVLVPTNDEVTAIPEKLESQRHFGYLLGVTLVDVGRMTVSAEVRFCDEKAAAVNAEFRF